MTQEISPITPPPELVAQWVEYAGLVGINEHQLVHLATQAARWGSNQELEACCEWLDQNTGPWDLSAELRAARSPKPPSLKKRALKILEEEPEADDVKELVVFDVDQVEIIRKALKQLDD